MNDVPIAADDWVFGGTEDAPYTFWASDLLVNDFDADLDVLTVTAVQNIGYPGGSVVLNADGSITYTPDPEVSGTAYFTYAVQDSSGAEHGALAGVEFEAVNDVPVPQPDKHWPRPTT